MRFRSVVLGGTFDRLHTGHQSLLTKAFSVGKHVSIGVTTDEYVSNIKNKKSKIKDTYQKSKILSYQRRKQQLEVWLNKQGFNGRYTIIPLNDPYGSTLLRPSTLPRQARDRSGLLPSLKLRRTGRTGKLPDFDAIVVSSETRKTAETINTLRKEKGLHILKIIEIPMIPAQDLHSVSSTRVRRGEIDTNGRLILPDNLRPELKKSIGSMISEKQLSQVLEKDTGKIVITVGDMTTEKLLAHGVRPTLSIIDFQMKRKPFLWDTEIYKKLVQNAIVHEVKSGPGYISGKARQAIHDTFKGISFKGVYSNQQNTVILVDGEEDLLVLPILVEAPIDSIVYYGQPAIPIWGRDSEMLAGQPKEGIVRVVITKEKKQHACALIGRFINAVWK